MYANTHELVIADPPLSVGAVHATPAEPFAGEAITVAGVFGALIAGVTTLVPTPGPQFTPLYA